MSHNNPSRKHRSRLSTPVRLCVAAVAACFIATPVLSNPVNPTVVNGAATFNQVGNLLTVTNSNGAIINWDKFSIKVGETTHFAQTAASSTVLNRVLNDPTAIYGTLSSNGRVWLVNPAGIMVGPGGRVDTAGFVASTLNISNENFLAGRNLFINDGGAGNVINQGQIRTPAGGSVYLIGSNVSNEGIITTPNGETILAAGATVSLIDSALPGVKVDITGAEGNATNLGTITAEAGRIGIAGVIVRNSGQINASSVVSEGGRVFLKASKDAYVDGNGRIVTTGTKGGSVEVLGNRVAVMDTAEIDASGTNGGGSIKVGGDYQGKNPDIQNASITWFGPNASLKADATGVGDGGTVIVWSDDTTRAYGSISARGGALGGDGGFVETSGKQSLDFAASVNTLAPHGNTGTLLLDPGFLSINDASWATYQSLGTNLILQTDSTGTGNISFSGSGAYNTFGYNLKVLAYGAGGASGNISFTDFRLAVAGDLALAAGWNGASTSTPVSIPTKGDIVMSGATFGTRIQAATMNVVAGHDLTLTSNASGDISSSQGPGVMLYSAGTQTITAGNQILLQAGSANNTYKGSPVYGGSVAIRSGGDQSVTAKTLILSAGASGHDNSATLEAYGGQTITLGTPGVAAGQLILTGGGNTAATYGGAYGGGFGGGSYNNSAEIFQKSSTGSQTINMVYGGSLVQLTGGNGTGYGGHHNPDYPGSAGWASNNFAAIHNQGDGGQTIDFHYGGSLTVTGGTAGNSNFASIGNWGEGILSIGSSNGTTYLPTIILAGGASGGAFAGGHDLSNAADIYSNASTALTQIYGASISISGYGGSATIGGAGIGANNLWLETPGNLTLTGGNSNAGTTEIPGAATPAFIGTNHYGSGSITIKSGGNVGVYGGSGSSGLAMIGTRNGGSSTAINIGAYGGIVLNSGGSGGSGVAIGNMARSDPYGGASVSLFSKGGIDVAGTATAPVMIGSLYGGAATSVTLGSERSIHLTHARVGNEHAGATSVSFHAGSVVGGGSSLYGGNLTFDNSMIGSALGDAALDFNASYAGAGTGNISFTDSGAYGASIAAHADRDLTFTGVSSGVRLQTTGSNGMTITADNLYAYGGDAINSAGANFFGMSTAGQGAGVLLWADWSPSAPRQTINVTHSIVLQAGNANNTLYGRSLYGGSVVIKSDADQAISAHTIRVLAGASGHDNSAEIQAYGSQSINITGSYGLLEVKGGGNSNSLVYGGLGSFNNQARIQHGMTSDGENYTGTGDQIITIYGGGSVSLQAGGGTGVLGYYSNECAASGAGTLCGGGSNSATIENGVGSQTLNFDNNSYGYLRITGGSAGRQNWAGIHNQLTAMTQNVLGYQAITITGGSGGGSAVSYEGKTFQLSNDAGIFSKGSGAQHVTAKALTLDAGTANYGGAGISNDSGQTLTIDTTGNLSMYGGSSSAGVPFAGGVYIANKNGGLIDLNIGGDLYIKAGSGTSSPAMIGTIEGAGNVDIYAGGNINIIADKSSVAIGSQSTSYGASVTINSGGSLTLTDSATSGVLIGSLFATDSQTNVNLTATNNVTIGSATGYGVLIGVKDSTASAQVNIHAGFSKGGGDLLLDSSSRIQAGADEVNLVAEQTTASNGNIRQNAGSTIYGGSVTFRAEGNATFYGSVIASTGIVYGSSGITCGGGCDASTYGGSMNFASTSIVSAYGRIVLESSKDITINGRMASTTGDIDIAAGGYRTNPDDPMGRYSSEFGGDVIIGGNIRAYGGSVNISANVGNYSFEKGDVTQTSDSSIFGNNSVSIVAGGSARLSGTVEAATGSLSIRAGYQTGYFGYDGSSGSAGVTPYGGNIVQHSGTLSGYSGVALIAEAGFDSGLNGDITQSAGTITTTAGNIKIIGGGKVELSGSTSAYGGYALVQSGYSSYGGGPSGSGGDITFNSGSLLYGEPGVRVLAGAGATSYGDIIQVGGTISSGSNSDITIVSAGNTTLNGTVSAGERIRIGAGLDPLNPSSPSPGGYGGDITFGSGSIVESRNGYEGNVISIMTSGGSRSQGDIVQMPGAQIIAGYGDVNILAYGDARMDGTTTIADRGYGIYVSAGVDNLSGLNSSFGGVRAGSSNIVSVSLFNNVYGGVEVKAAGAILRSASNPNDVNIVADSVSLTSVYGGSPGGIAISAFTEATGSITAKVVTGASYGGISIQNFGLQPDTISLTDNATYPGTGLGGRPMSIAFYNSGDLAIDAGTTFSTGNSGDIAITSGGNLDYTDKATAPSTTNNILLGADSNLTMYGGLTTAGDLKLSADGTLDVNAAIGGYNIELGASIININANANVIPTATVTAANNVALVAPGGTINLSAGVTAGGTSATPSYINGIAYWGIAIIAQDVIADGPLAYLHATTATGNISGLVSGNITLDNGAYFDAAKDVDLVLAGTASTLSLLNGGYFLASPTTIKLDFSNRSSGGLVISGGGGLFVGSVGHVATKGDGLELDYGVVTTSVAVDPCVTNPTLCKTVEPDKTPTDNKAPPPPDTTKTDPTKPPVDLSKTTGGTEGTFGSEAGKSDLDLLVSSAPTSVGNAEKDKKDEGTATVSIGKDEKKGEQKDEKKDEKDKKDKKSDEAKDEKKDDKPAAKKVAQCS